MGTLYLWYFFCIWILFWYLRASWALLQSYEGASLNWEEDSWFNSWNGNYTWGWFCWVFWCSLRRSLQIYSFHYWLCFQIIVWLQQKTLLWCSSIIKLWPSRGLSTCSLSTTHWCIDAWSWHPQHLHQVHNQEFVLWAHSSEEEDMLNTFWSSLCHIHFRAEVLFPWGFPPYLGYMH